MRADKLKVVAGVTDISNLVMDMTLHESIEGYARGTLHILDGTNYYDSVLGQADNLTNVQVTFYYMEIECTNTFAMDGIGDVVIKKNKKEYDIHLISPVEQDLRTTKVNNVYSGTSNDILRKLWDECTGIGSGLKISGIAVTKGKYIVPNIFAVYAINNVVKGAVDSYHTGFYLYQRIWEWGITRYTSLKYMSEDFMVDPNNKEVTLSNPIPTQKDITANPHKMIDVGTSNKFVVKEYKADLTGKVAAGQWGNKIHHINLDETKIIKNKAIQITANEITTHKISDKLYDNIIPGAAGQSYQQQSLFSTMNDPINVAADNKKARAQNTKLNVSDITPIPYIGAGHSIKVFQGGGDKSISKADGPYVIADINHMFHRNDDNSFEYNQNMTLIREML
jgi:hypothetical protein